MWEVARSFQPTLGTPPSQGLITPEALPTTSVRICVEASLCRHDGLNHCHWWLIQCLVPVSLSLLSQRWERKEGDAESPNPLLTPVGSPGHQHPSWLFRSHLVSIQKHRQLSLWRFQGFEELCATRQAGGDSSPWGMARVLERDHLTNSYLLSLLPFCPGFPFALFSPWTFLSS